MGRDEGRELDVLGYPALRPSPPGPEGCSVPATEPFPAAPAGLWGVHSPRPSNSLARSPVCSLHLLPPRGHCSVAAFQGGLECNYLVVLITRRARISPSSSSMRAQQQLA